MDNIEQILVLIGRNGAGKSNLLKAIEWAARTALPSANTSTDKNSSGQSDFYPWQSGEVTLSFVLEGETYSYYIKKQQTVYLDEKNEVQTKKVFIEKIFSLAGGNPIEMLSRDGEMLILDPEVTYSLIPKSLQISDSAPCMPILQSMLPKGDAYRDLVEKIINFFASVKYYPLQSYESDSMAVTIFRGLDYKAWVAKEFSGSDPVASLMLKILHMYLQQTEKFAELHSLLGGDGLGLIEEISVQIVGGSDASESYYFIRFKPITHQNNTSFTFNDLSFGTRRVIALLVSMLFDSSSVSLIEQPEDGVHVGLVDKLMPLLRSYADDTQFIIASHSAALMNRVEPHEIRIVEINNGLTSARTLSEDELVAAHNYLKEDGSFAEFLESI